MHQHRRRKKRPSYGIRTVEISRGKNGFGFTISGQAPCILSCIVAGSPAEQAGLRPGDFLIAVNGQNVSKVPHDDVVRFIGNSTGILKLQIAENYYSDSSDEELITVLKPRQKCAHRVRRQQHNVSRAEKVVRDLQTGALFVDHIHGARTEGESFSKRQSTESNNNTNITSLALTARSNKALLDLILQQRLQGITNKCNIQRPLSRDSPILLKQKQQTTGKKKELKVIKSHSHPEHLNTSGSAEIFHSIFTEQDLNSILYPSNYANHNQNDDNDEDENRAILRAVVGYLGTIEMPKEPQMPSSRLQTIRSCIRRLRIEKKVHTLVLLSVFTESVILTNPHGLTLAEFSAEKITFSGVYADDKKFFGLVTNHGTSSDELSEGSQEEAVTISSSCHVFMVDAKLMPHHQHLKRAKAFHITCTPDPVTNKCQEFPESAEVILQAIVGLYRNRLGLNVDAAPGMDFHVNMSPQPSNTSSNSSNSDSGIGFRDEGNTSDRVFIVDVDSYHYSTNSLDRQAFSGPGFLVSEAALRTFCFSQDGVIAPKYSQFKIGENKANCSGKVTPSFILDKLTVRAMPDPVGYDQSSSSFNSENLDDQSNPSNLRNSMHKYMQTKQESTDTAKVHDNNQIAKDMNQLSYVRGTKPCSNNSVTQNSKVECNDIQSYKLSPKVYGLDFPAQSPNSTQIGLGCMKGKGASQSMEKLHSSTPDENIMKIESQDLFEQDIEYSSQVAQPSTQNETESDNSEVDHGLEITKKWTRTSSLRRHFGRKRSLHRSTHETGIVSDGELASGKASTSSSMLCLDHISDTTSTRRSSCNSERPVDVGRVGSWAAGFHILLEDPAGLHTFTEFLKKEFSQENITFWVACEEYRQLKDQNERKCVAKDIYTNHLCIGAQEPVNVDSHARQMAQDNLDNPSCELFLPAQKQIFNLMKFDCYQRFLKSSMFKECMMREVQGEPLFYPVEEKAQSSNGHLKMKRKEDAEEKKRKSLIPWHRLNKTKSVEMKNDGNKSDERRLDIRRSLKKKKREKDEPKRLAEDTCSTRSDMTGSHSSLASSETGALLLSKNMPSRESLSSAELAMFPVQCGKEGCYLCRVILPDCSTTVIRTQKGETLGEMLQRLIERRSLNYTAVEAFFVGSDQPLDLSLDVGSLSCKEIRVEQVVLFCLELPNRKAIGVKAKPGKLCVEVLKPVLQKYGYRLDIVAVSIARSGKKFLPNAPITDLDNQKVTVRIRDCTDNMPKRRESSTRQAANSRVMSELEEITNQIFEDLLKGKSQFQFDELGVVDLDHSSPKVKAKTQTVASNLLRRNSLHIDKDNAMTNKTKLKFAFGNRASVHEGMGMRTQIQNSGKHEFSKKKNHSSNVDDLKKRGIVDSKTSKNGYYSGKENSLSSGNKRSLMDNKPKNKVRSSCSDNSKVNLSSFIQHFRSDFHSDSILPTPQQAEDYFSSALRCRTSLGFEERSNTEKFLSSLGIMPSSLDLKASRTLPPGLSHEKVQSRPVSHPSTRIFPSHSLAQNLPLNSHDSSAARIVSPTSELENTLIGTVSNIDLDLEMDTTIKAPLLSDDSLSPSRLPLPPDVGNISLQLEEANFPPPPPLESASKDEYHINKEVAFSKPPLRKMNCEPPPIPPKALSRGPPPRPPSRQLVNINSGFCPTSDEDAAEDVTSSLNKKEQRIRTKRFLHLEGNDTSVNISFV